MLIGEKTKMIKEIESSVVYRKKHEVIKLDVNGKTITVETVDLQDEQFGNFESDWEVTKHVDNWTEDDEEELGEYMMDR
jgi:hypothetical protein